MARATLINDRDLERDYRLANGTVVTLRLSDFFHEITFYINGRQLPYRFEFKELDSGGYKLKWAFTNELKGNGLGRATLEYFTEYTHEKVYASPHDGRTRNDGSELTGGAPGFVATMIKEGLIAGYDDPSYNIDAD